MEIKLFGKSLFSIGESKKDYLIAEVAHTTKESKYVTDFYTLNNGNGLIDNIVIIPDSTGNAIAVDASKLKKKPKKEIKLTPKGVYEMKMLNDKTFKLNTDEKYVDKQISDFKDKLKLIKSEEYDMRRGVNEIASILMRLENRKKYAEVKEFFEEFPYTTTSRIADLVKDHDYLKLGQVAQFLADMPKEAVDVMKKYNEYTEKLCKKQAVFYIIADKKDFQKSEKRRDPILLAQSPFGHFWQILGAWDKEMMLIEEL